MDTTDQVAELTHQQMAEMVKVSRIEKWSREMKQLGMKCPHIDLRLAQTDTSTDSAINVEELEKAQAKDKELIKETLTKIIGLL